MTKKQKENLIQEIRNLLTEKGWSEDRFGNFKKNRADKPGCEYRYKFGKTSLRLESSFIVNDYCGKPEKHWTRLRSGYYANLKVVDGKISGLKF